MLECLPQRESTMIATANPDFGFHGTLASRYGDALAKLVYDAAASDLIADGFNQLGAITVLDASAGRHWADAMEHPTPDEFRRIKPSMASWLRTFTRRPRRVA